MVAQGLEEAYNTNTQMHTHTHTCSEVYNACATQGEMVAMVTQGCKGIAFSRGYRLDHAAAMKCSRLKLESNIERRVSGKV